MDSSNVTGVVLAGGLSRRMGRDKTALVWEGQPLAEHSAAVLRRLFPQTLVIREDDKPGCGPLGGLATALRQVQTPAIFAVACDLPFLDGRLIRYLVSVWQKENAVAIHDNGRFEPLCAGYRRNCLPAIERQLVDGAWSLQELLRGLDVRRVEAPELNQLGDWRKWLRNVNTPEDWEQARRDG